MAIVFLLIPITGNSVPAPGNSWERWSCARFLQSFPKISISKIDTPGELHIIPYRGTNTHGTEECTQLCHRGTTEECTQSCHRGTKEECTLSCHRGTEMKKVVDSASLTHRKYFQKLGLTEIIWENIMGYVLLIINIQVSWLIQTKHRRECNFYLCF